MAETLNITLCQLNPVVGDPEGNAAQIREAYASACRDAGDLIVFPELFLVGYPLQDLVLLPSFQEAVDRVVDGLVAETAGKACAMILGTIRRVEGRLHNAALFIEDGRILHTILKHHLPNSGVFDEKRLFAEGGLADPFEWRGLNWGILICEDMWHDDAFERLSRTGADAVIVINGSPFEEGKQEQREAIVARAARKGGMAIFYANMVSGQDELVFDGNSFAADSTGEVIHRSPAFRPDIARITLEAGRLAASMPPEPILEVIPAVYGAAVLGLRDYVLKNGARSVLLGLSGGIDSALVAAIAVDALGAEAVRAVMLPYRYTSSASLKDAAEIAQNLGIRYDVLPIEKAMEGALAMLAPLAAEGVPSLLGHENMQARLRGVALMTLSNSLGGLLLSTGNKSEMAMGYSTLYGDMCGAFNPLKDIYKTQVFALCRWRNANRPPDGFGPEGELIPERVIIRPPSAELRENQKDEDSLPPYETLDRMLHALIEERKSAAEVMAMGFSEADVARVSKLLYLSEYKRFQSPPGPKVSRMNFGWDRRYPLTNRWKL